MKRTDTWKPLGSLTTQIAAKLMERREAELKEDGSLDPKAETAAKCPLLGDRATERTRGTAAMNRTEVGSGEEVGADLNDMGRKVGPAGPKRGGERVAGNVIYLWHFMPPRRAERGTRSKSKRHAPPR